VAITDSGTPGLSATSNFTVTVNPTTHPGAGSVTVLGGRVNLMASGPQGPDYTVLTSTRTPPTQKFNFGVRVNNICHRLGNELNYTIPKITAEGFYQTRNPIVLQLKISVAGWSHKNLPK